MTLPIWKDFAAAPGVHFGATLLDVERDFAGGLPVYLATPYSKIAVDFLGGWSHDASLWAARLAAIAADQLRARGVSAFSPIAQAVMQVNALGNFVLNGNGSSYRFEPTVDPLDADLWMRWCLPFLHVCGAVVVPDIKGWDGSVGIAAEVRTALDLSLPVYVYGSAP
jgi:hypothetical protein